MSKEIQIEEMAKALNEATFGVNTQTLADHLKPETINKVAEYLYNSGYHKQSEVEKLENKLFTEVFESVLFSLVYLGADGKWHTRRNNAEKTTAIIERYLKLVAIKEGGAE